ncbi:hypothetical protein K435DRAFT_859851 [Dendrothele bispora CBS 962.96]|uniref:Uncharacterized protein n=1 Tax=Dendrothele bispora (strain CBS 962.96) TaxID=1314807 RepID=A0A4S8LZE5_DENBC|nr:hypothetical protein K435DRAFT_859851 [Dendrothele bispora CBS 962.96]
MTGAERKQQKNKHGGARTGSGRKPREVIVPEVSSDGVHVSGHNAHLPPHPIFTATRLASTTQSESNNDPGISVEIGAPSLHSGSNAGNLFSDTNDSVPNSASRDQFLSESEWERLLAEQQQAKEVDPQTDGYGNYVDESTVLVLNKLPEKLEQHHKVWAALLAENATLYNSEISRKEATAILTDSARYAFTLPPQLSTQKSRKGKEKAIEPQTDDLTTTLPFNDIEMADVFGTSPTNEDFMVEDSMETQDAQDASGSANVAIKTKTTSSLHSESVGSGSGSVKKSRRRLSAVDFVEMQSRG